MKATSAAAAALLLSIGLTGTAGATTPTVVEGTFTSTVTVTSVRFEGGNIVVAGSEVQTLSGALIGTRVAEGVQVIHPDGTFTAHDTGTFTGTANGRSGSVVIDGTSTGVGDTGFGQLVVRFGTEGLAGLHGHGTFEPVFTGPTTVAGTYSIDLHVDP